MLIRCAVCCALLIAAFPALAEDSDVLEQVRQRMRDNLSHLPDYTCLETIERFERRRWRSTPELMDIVRLEVALISGRELFSWPGAGTFEDRPIDRLVPLGTIGTGTFALQATSIFLGQPLEMTGPAEETKNGRHVLRWNYVIPAEGGRGWSVRNGPAEGFVGIRGAFWADAETKDVLRLEKEGMDVPPRLGIDRVHSSVTYARMNIGQGSFLLPATAVMTMRETSRLETTNRMRFSQCRQYMGQSELHFEDTAPDVESEGSGLRRIELPPDIVLPVILQTPIRFGKTAAGDMIRFRLDRTISDGKAVLFPKGSVVSGRITTFRRDKPRREEYLVGMELHDLRSATTEAPVYATLDRPPGAEYTLPLLAEKWAGTSLDVRSGAVFLKSGGPTVIRAGTRFEWRTRNKSTAAPPPKS